jgi:hypothetical protein
LFARGYSGILIRKSSQKPRVESGANKQELEVFTSDDRPYGKSYGSWTNKWWRWALGSPRSTNPLLDETGIHSNTNQSGDVWFLAGKFGSEDKNIPLRRCSIPVRKAVLFPILNCEANSLEYPALITEDDLIEHVAKDVNSVVLRNCFLNGRRLKPERVQSDPKIFELTIPAENPLRLDRTGKTRAAADGYWVFLKPMPAGDFSLYFEGSCENGRLHSGAIYSINILE